jgi:hypothetical protein
MIINENFSGGIKLAGCIVEEFFKNYNTLYGPGDVVYSLIKANRGVLEKVIIKSQKLIKSKKTYNRFVVLYTDTLNGLWNESDLIEFDDAKLIAENYWFDKLVDIENIKKC